MLRLTSYQGIDGTTFADAHLLINRFKVFIQLHILHAAFECRCGDVIPLKGAENAVIFLWEKIASAQI